MYFQQEETTTGEIVVQGTNAKQAANKASLLLKVPVSNLDIQVINHGQPGPMGSGKPAIIRAKVRGTSNSSISNFDSDNGKMTDSVTAEVRERKLVVCHPEGGPYPVVIPTEGIKLLVNGIKKNGPTIIVNSDQVELIPEDEIIEGRWHLQITKDGSKALLSVVPTRIITRQIKDVRPSKQLALRAEEKVQYRSPLTTEQVRNLLADEGVIVGINWTACLNATKVEKEETLVIAEALPPSGREDARIKFFFEKERRIPVEMSEEDLIDYRERFVFTSVKAGELLAEKQPGGPGKPGTTVQGELILPEPPREVYLVAGQGVSLTEDGMRAIATENGTPMVTRLNDEVRLKVLPCFTYPGDVNLASGNIRYNGSITVLGSVGDGMTVEGLGDIQIKGDVDNALVQAVGSISIGRKAISSTIIAGSSSFLLIEVTPIIMDLAKNLAELLIAIDQIRKLPKVKTYDFGDDVRPIIKLLLEIKFRHLPAQVESLCSLIQLDQSQMLTDNTINLILKFRDFFQESADPIQLQGLYELQLELNKNVEELAAMVDTHADMEMEYVLNSTLKTSGNITIFGQGCYNSSIAAGGDIHIRNIFRGGDMYAAGNVTIRELGSRGGAPVKVKTLPQGVVKLGMVWENCLVQIGSESHLFETPLKNLIIKLDKKGQLNFVSY